MNNQSHTLPWSEAPKLLAKGIIRPTIALVIVAICGLTAFAAPPSTETLNSKQFSKLLTYYYVDKNPKDLNQIIEYSFLDKTFKDKTSVVAPMVGFYSVALRENPEAILQLKGKQHLLSNIGRNILHYSLILADKEEYLKPIGLDPDRSSNFESVILAEKPITEPADFDALWGAFSASGDLVYVDHIINSLDRMFLESETEGSPNEETVKHHMKRSLLVRAGLWSLNGNAIKHSLVYNNLKTGLPRQSQGFKDALEKVVLNAEQKKSPPLWEIQEKITK